MTDCANNSEMLRNYTLY